MCLVLENSFFNGPIVGLNPLLSPSCFYDPPPPRFMDTVPFRPPYLCAVWAVFFNRLTAAPSGYHCFFDRVSDPSFLLPASLRCVANFPPQVSAFSPPNLPARMRTIRDPFLSLGVDGFAHPYCSSAKRPRNRS